MADGEILFEFTRVGQHMRVVALDPDTATEVMVIGPANASRHHLQQLATAKLRRKLAESVPAPPRPPGKFA